MLSSNQRKTKMGAKFIYLFIFILLIANCKTITACNKNSLQDELISQNEKIANSFEDGTVSFRMKKAVVPFIGRNTEIKEIQSQFQSKENQILVIHGPRGIGKTELARKYAEFFKKNNEKNSLIWIDSESLDSINYFFQELGNFIGVNIDGKIPSELFEEVFHSFGNDKKALFIIDEAPNNIFILNSVQKFLPTNSEIKILITSQDSSWKPNFKLLRLSAFSEDNSVEFLTQNLALYSENYTDARKVAEILQNIPLALSKAAKYIKDEKYSLVDFLEEYEDHSKTNMPSITLDPIEEILRQEEQNPKQVRDSTHIFEDLGLRPGPVLKAVLVEKIRPPTSAELRNFIKTKVRHEARRTSRKIRKFFQSLRNDIIG